MRKKFILRTLSVGCPKNMIESATYRKILLDNDYEEVSNEEEADCVVLNTCGCLETLQTKAKNAAYNLALDKYESVVVAGCYPFVDKGNTLEEDGFKIVEPGDYDGFSDLLQLKNSSEEATSFSDTDFKQQPSLVSSPTKVFSLLVFLNRVFNVYSLKVIRFFKAIMMSDIYRYVTVGSGCSGSCTFCGIKNAIGNPKSRTLGNIIIQFEKVLAQKGRNIWLVSDDIGSWGVDTNSSPAILLKHLLKYPNDFRLVLNYFEPEMFLKHEEALLELFKDKRIEQICIPLQTGSQSLLRRMGRHYDIKESLVLIKKLKSINPDLVVKSQFIVGFPGETWGDFLKSLIAMSKYDGVGVNAYARLKYTAAYRLTPHSDYVVSMRSFLAKSFSYLLYIKLLPSLFKLKWGKYEV